MRRNITILLLLFISSTCAHALDMGGFFNGFKSTMGSNEQLSKEDRLLNLIDFNKGYVSKSDRQAKTLELWNKAKGSIDTIEKERIQNIPNPSLTMVQYDNLSSATPSSDGYIEFWVLTDHIFSNGQPKDIISLSTATRYLAFCEKGLLLNAGYLSFKEHLGRNAPWSISDFAVPITGENAKQFRVFRAACGLDKN